MTSKIALTAGHKGLQDEDVQNWEDEMTIAVMVFRMAFVSALAVGVLIAVAGLLSLGGTPQAFAQADTTAPTISSIAITSDTGDIGNGLEDDGVYGIGDRIRVTVTFSEDINVTGSPRLELDIGGAAKPAEYESAEGSNVVFGYTVIEGDADNDGIAVGENKLTLNAGSIKDAANNEADLSHEALAAQNDHRVDGIRPTISYVRLVISLAMFNGTYVAGETLVAHVDFNEDVLVMGSPQLALDFQGTTRLAEQTHMFPYCEPEEGQLLLCGSSLIRGITIGFGATILEGDEDNDGVAIAANALSLNGGTIEDAAGNGAVLTHDAVAPNSSFLVDGVPPTISAIAITSDPGDDNSYGVGDQVEVTVTFSENVRVTTRHYRPRLMLDIGGKPKVAKYVVPSSPNPMKFMKFTYTVEDGDNDNNGIAVGANKLQLLGTKVYDTPAGNPANITHQALPDDPEHTVSTPATGSEHEETSNTLKSGLVKITGEARVGATLTADPSGIIDDDGVDHAEFLYLWLSDRPPVGMGLSGEHPSPHYELQTGDAGDAISVRASFYDDAGNSEVRFSAALQIPTAPNDNFATGLITISGTAQVGETLTVDVTGISDDDGLENAAFSYQWVRSDGGSDSNIQDATGSSYTLTGDDEGKTIKVTVSFTDAEGNPETLTSDPTGEVEAKPNTRATGAPIIDGIARVGETLTADTSGIDDEDELTNVAFSYQWLRNDGSGDAVIAGATGSTYTLVAADEGKTVKVVVSFMDDEGNPETLASDPTGAVAPDPGPLTVFTVVDASTDPDTPLGALVDEGTLILGNPTGGEYGVRVNTDSSHDDHDDIQKVVLALSGAKDVNRPEKHSPYSLYGDSGEDNLNGGNLPVGSYTLTATAHRANGDVLGTLEVSFTVEAQEQTAVPNNEPTGAPTIRGTAQVGETLTVDVTGISDDDGLENAAFTYQWTRSDGGSDRNIQDANGSSYTLTGDDEGKTIKVTVSFTDAEGNPETLTSDPTGEVEAKPNTRATGAPIIDGIARVGETLTADTSGIDDEDELTNVAFSYQWLRNDGSGDAVIVGATGSTYTLVAADEGKTVKVVVSFMDDEGNPETLASDPTGAVAPDPGPLTVFTVVDASTDPDTPLGALVDEGTLILGNPTGGEYGVRVNTDSSHDDHDDIQKVVLALSGAKDVNRPEKHSPYSLYGDSGEDNLNGGNLPVGSYTLTATAHRANGDVLGTLEVSFTVEAQEQTAVPNNEPTGAPTIRGTAQVGETLTVDVTGISDDDGLENAAFTYQWTRSDGGSDRNIQDANGSSYTLTGDDEGKTIKVTVSFTDAEGNPETLTSDPTGEVEAKPNTRATGAPIIDGIARVGETLTADTSGIDDEDELTNVAFSYQWTRNDGSGDAVITGATGSTYTLVADDEGKTIKVTVSFTDDRGNPETLTSNPTGEVAPESGPLTTFTVVDTSTDPDKTLGTLEDGGTLTLEDPDSDIYGIRVDTDSNHDDHDDIHKVVLVLSGAKNVNKPEWEPPYSLYGDSGAGNLDGGNLPVGSYDLKATAYKNNGDVLGTLKVSFSVEAQEQTAVPNNEPTGAPTIDGIARVGETLTADTSGIDDDDELTNVVFAYQWIRRDGSGDAVIAGATNPTYTLVSEDEGKTIEVRVSFTDDEGNPETLTSDPTGEVEAKPNTEATGAPIIDGIARVGETLTADTSGIDDEDELTNVAFSYQWLRDNAEIASATGSSYTLVADDEGKTIKVTVSFTDAEGNPETLTSEATGVVTAEPNTKATGAPTIDGIARVGETLTADTSGIDDEDGLTDVVFSYQWTRNDGSGDTEIQDATGSTYTLVKADEGKTIKVTVSFTDAEGNSETLTSDPTGEVEAKPNTEATGAPIIDGIAREGETLTADTSDINDGDGLDSVVFAYQWLRDDAEIAGATGETYTLVADDEGRTIKVTVSFTDDQGNAESLTSDPTSEVEAAVVKPGRPQDLEGNASAQGIALTWNAPAGSAVTSYVIYRAVLDQGHLHGKPMTRYATIDATGAEMAYTDAEAEAGVEYRYRVAAVNSAGEGKKSNWINIFAEDS